METRLLDPNFLSWRLRRFLKKASELTWTHGSGDEPLELVKELTEWAECKVLNLAPDWQERASEELVRQITSDSQGFFTLSEQQDRDLFQSPSAQQVAWAYLDPQHEGNPESLLVACHAREAIDDEEELTQVAFFLQTAAFVLEIGAGPPEGKSTFELDFSHLRQKQADCRERMESGAGFDADLLSSYKRIQSWDDEDEKANPYVFQRFVDETLRMLFPDDLANPRLEQPIHGSLGVIDIVYRNCATRGFFHDLMIRHSIECPYILVECKNLSRPPKNREIHQLLGRFGTGRGSFGLLVCREVKVEDREDLLRRCREISRDGLGLVMALDLADLAALLAAKMSGEEELENLLDDHLRMLVF